MSVASQGGQPLSAPFPAPVIPVGRLVAGHHPEALIATHGSPLFVYALDVLRARIAALRAALPERVEVAFAVKSNPAPVVLRALGEMGLGADVASGGELRAVLRAGIPAGRIVFTGPGKTDAELEAALRAGIGALTIESLDELGALLDMRGLAAPGQGLMLRLATGGAGEERAIIGGSDKFGLLDEEAQEALAQLLHTHALAPNGPFRLRGVHAFGASNVRDAGILAAALRDLARRAEALAERHGLALELLDMGGGLGIPYSEDEAELDLPELGRLIGAELATWPARGPLAGARALIEPGRWIVGPAGAYLCRVTRTKPRAGRTIAVVDGGIHHLLRPVLVGQAHRIVAVGPAAERPVDRRVDVVGPLCTGLDVLALDIPAPNLARGDILAVLDAGAYGATESMPWFLSHPVPAEIAVDGSEVVVSRQRLEAP